MIKALTIALLVVLAFGKTPKTKLGDNVDDCAYFIGNLKDDFTSILSQIVEAKLASPLHKG